MKIIGVSGGMQSGKDTVAAMIVQWNEFHGSASCDMIAFADPLKALVLIIFVSYIVIQG